jgi:hypothetical protein
MGTRRSVSILCDRATRWRPVCCNAESASSADLFGGDQVRDQTVTDDLHSNHLNWQFAVSRNCFKQLFLELMSTARACSCQKLLVASLAAEQELPEDITLSCSGTSVCSNAV